MNCMKNAFFFIFFFCVLSSATFATEESPYTGGLKHTIVKNQNAPYIKSDPKGENARPPPQPAHETKAQTPAEKVWDKYKALAAGQYEEPKTESSKTQIEESKTEAPEGFSSVLKKYQENRTKGSQMRSLKTSGSSIKHKTLTTTSDPINEP